MEPENKQDTIKNRLQHLLCTIADTEHPSSCFKALAEIRSNFITDPKKRKLFIQSSGIKNLVKQLQCENTKIVDITLSILGHCVLEQDPRVIVSINFHCNLVVLS